MSCIPETNKIKLKVKYKKISNQYTNFLPQEIRKRRTK